MKMSFVTVMALFGFISCTGTDAGEGSGPAQAESQSKNKSSDKTADYPEICYVLCDFSASQGDKSRRAIQLNALKVYDAATKKSKLSYFNINGSPFEGAFFEFRELIKEANTPEARRKTDQKATLKRQELDSLLTKNCTTGNSSQTCIVRSLTKIVSLLANQEHDKNRKISVIILSDMLEDCEMSFGRLDIDRGRFENAFKVLSNMSTPAFTFKGYGNLTITLTACSERQIDPENLFKFWREVLNKYDYPLTTPISPALPNWVINAK